MSDWFYDLFGFHERDPASVRREFSLSGSRLRCWQSGKELQCGDLEIISLSELRTRSAAIAGGETARLRLTELIADARALHLDTTNAGAMFQVASQFNLLEMVSPDVTPEQGITIYENDRTQGPACAIACGAGTIYRNYFVKLDGQVGQTASKQVDCLSEIGRHLSSISAPATRSHGKAALQAEERQHARLWEMRNGYALPSAEGLKRIDTQLDSMSEAELDSLRSKLKIGVQWNTQVTLQDSQHLVTQAYCSAMPVAYSGLPSQLWERFARLILEAAYEATLAAAVINASQTGNKSVFLTLLGGGAFGNDQQWIVDAILRACRLFHSRDLDVRVVSFRSSNSAVQKIVDAIKADVPSTASEDNVPVTREYPDHYCPGCGQAQKTFLRYPWYFCQSCLALAEDGQGRRLEFANVSLSGGLCWRYANSSKNEWQEHATVVCLLHGRPVVVTEARFGGVAAQPLNSIISDLGHAHSVIDLRQQY